MQIRSARPDDAASLAALAALTFPLACPPDALPESIAEFIAVNLSTDRFAEYLADPERELFVADEGGELVGYTMVVHGEPYDEDVRAAVPQRPASELSKMYVHPDHHGEGIAAQLVERSLAAARERGAAVVWLGVNQLNDRANRFYAKQGFERVGTKRFQVGRRFEDDFVRARTP